MQPPLFRLMTEDDVRGVLPASEFPALVELMEATLKDFSAGRLTQPVRSALPVGPPGQYLGVMPALLPGSSAIGAKLVSVVPGNAARGLSTHLGVVVLFDTVTGALLAVMDARYITEVRTAAVSAVSARWLARPDACRLAVIGTGVQARSHLEVLAAVRPLSSVHAWGPDRPQRETYAREMSSQLALTVIACERAEDAVKDADLIVLATTSSTPVIRRDWVRPGSHVISVGACRPDQREIDPLLLAAAYLVVDSRAAALVESGDIVSGVGEGHFTAEHVRGEIGEVVAGRVAGRTDPSQITVFKSLGLAVEDIATASLAYHRAEAQRSGRLLQL